MLLEKILNNLFWGFFKLYRLDTLAPLQSARCRTSPVSSINNNIYSQLALYLKG